MAVSIDHVTRDIPALAHDVWNLAFMGFPGDFARFEASGMLLFRGLPGHPVNRKKMDT